MKMITPLIVIILMSQSAIGRVSVYESATQLKIDQFDDSDSFFGKKFDEGTKAFILKANPFTACGDTIDPPPYNYSITAIYVALIKRGNCTFARKVYVAQNSGYLGAIIYNNIDDRLFRMTQSSSSKLQIMIPSRLIGLHDGLKMKHEYVVNARNKRKFYLVFDENFDFNPQMYIIAFLGFVSLGFFLIGVGFGAKLCGDFIRRRANRLRKCHLKKIPQKKFVKGEDAYDTCAICLEDYEEGDKLRILPCHHAYHSSCIDPWLLRQKRNCPICKTRIIIPGYNEDQESLHEGSTNAQADSIAQSPESTSTHRTLGSIMSMSTGDGQQINRNNVLATSNTSINTTTTLLSNNNFLIHNETTPLITNSANIANRDNNSDIYKSISELDVQIISNSTHGSVESNKRNKISDVNTKHGNNDNDNDNDTDSVLIDVNTNPEHNGETRKSDNISINNYANDIVGVNKESANINVSSDNEGDAVDTVSGNKAETLTELV